MNEKSNKNLFNCLKFLGDIIYVAHAYSADRVCTKLENSTYLIQTIMEKILNRLLDCLAKTKTQKYF